jgi:hypothetical protein
MGEGPAVRTVYEQVQQESINVSDGAPITGRKTSLVHKDKSIFYMSGKKQA